MNRSGVRADDTVLVFRERCKARALALASPSEKEAGHTACQDCCVVYLVHLRPAARGRADSGGEELFCLGLGHRREELLGAVISC